MKREDDFFDILLGLEIECPICGKTSKIGRKTIEKNIDGFYTCSCGYHILYFDVTVDSDFLSNNIKISL